MSLISMTSMSSLHQGIEQSRYDVMFVGVLVACLMDCVAYGEGLEDRDQ